MSASGASTPSSVSNPSLTASLLRARPYHFATQCATVDNPDPSHQDRHGSSSVPIYQSATFKGMGGQYDYTRSGNPTRTHLQHHVAKISSAAHSFAVTSGMGALDVIFRLLKPGDEIIAGNDLYGGSNRLLTYLKEHNGITTHHVNTIDPENFKAPLAGGKIKMVLLESPTNPLLQIADIETISSLVHKANPDTIVVVDNTMMSPYLQLPLKLGADIVYDSGTKYLSGHHDLMAGVICCNRDDLAKGMYNVINSIGNGLSPQDCFLLLRGIKTLALRLDRQQASSQLVAEYLYALGFKVNYPGLASHPGKAVHDRLAKGAGAVLSFETGDKALSEKIVGAARLWGISVSFGCVNSLISMPCLMSHASISPAVRKERNLPEDLIRLCVGIEDPRDLIDDLEAALLEAGAIRVVDEAGERAKLERVRGPEEELEEQLKVVSLGDKVDRIVTSAPGKVILFGEHAVVHGVTAIAGSLDLRCYCLSQSRPDSQISLNFPDIPFARTWQIDALPWSRVPTAGTAGKPPRADEPLDEGFLEALKEGPMRGVEKTAAAAGTAFLYLYMSIARTRAAGERLAQSVTVRSALPIGAGLGSSAAFSVAAASALLYTHRVLPLPEYNTLHDGRAGVPEPHREAVNGWALVAEKVVHGNPSGVDNTVATYGGAIAFRKAVKGREGSSEGLHGFKSVRLLLTDTKISRDTKSLVAGVAKRKLEEPDVINPIMSRIQAISDEARRTLLDGEMARKDQIAILEGLVEENHAHLVTLGVGHTALEVIKARTAEQPWGLRTKLTGAGGGGCAVTLIPDDFPQALLDELKASLQADGFVTYESTVGGSGFGLVVPSSEGGDAVTSGETGQKSLVPDVAKFRELNGEDLEAWVKTAGSWVYA